MQLAQDILDSERTKVEAWRLQQLLRAGWTLHRASQLAAREDVDIHRANDLLDKGCDQKTALKILL